MFRLPGGTRLFHLSLELQKKCKGYKLNGNFISRLQQRSHIWTLRSPHSLTVENELKHGSSVVVIQVFLNTVTTDDTMRNKQICKKK